jgi:hypothetical protein
MLTNAVVINHFLTCGKYNCNYTILQILERFKQTIFQC